MHKSKVFYNAPSYKTDSRSVDPLIFKEKYDISDFLLFVGRIEPLKNPNIILELFGDNDIPKVFLGKLSESHGGYTKKFLKLIAKSKNAYYLGFINSFELLNSAYCNARTTILPSWNETCGMVILDALINGCNSVIVDTPATREYFNEVAFFCSPDDPISIKRAISRSLASPPPEKESVEKVLKRCTWENAAKIVYDAYKAVLS